MGSGVLDLRRRARRGRSRLFCVCELHDTRLWRRASRGTLAAAWRYNRDDRHVAIWMVDRSHFRGATANFGAHTRSQRLTTLMSVRRFPPPWPDEREPRRREAVAGRSFGDE